MQLYRHRWKVLDWLDVVLTSRSSWGGTQIGKIGIIFSPALIFAIGVPWEISVDKDSRPRLRHGLCTTLANQMPATDFRMSYSLNKVLHQPHREEQRSGMGKTDRCYQQVFTGCHYFVITSPIFPTFMFEWCFLS